LANHRLEDIGSLMPSSPREWRPHDFRFAGRPSRLNPAAATDACAIKEDKNTDEN
jgi:hypothetical protein